MINNLGIFLTFGSVFIFTAIRESLDFNLTKEVFFDIAVFFILLLYVIEQFYSDELENIKVYFTRSAIVLTILFGWAFLSILWSKSPLLAWRGIKFYLPFVLFYFILLLQFQNPKFKDKFLHFLCLTSFFLVIIGILQFFGFRPFINYQGSGKFSIIGLAGNPNLYANLLILPLFLFLYFFFITRKVFYLFWFFIAGVTIFLVRTRAVWVASLISVLYFSLMYSRFLRKVPKAKTFITKMTIYIIILIFLSLALLYLVYPKKIDITIRSFLVIFTKPLSDSNIYVRWNILPKLAFSMMKDNPILGNGLNSFKYLSPIFLGKLAKSHPDLFRFSFNGIPQRVHNEYLQILSELGLIGLFIFIVMIFFYFEMIFKNLKEENLSHNEQILLIISSSIVLGYLIDALFSFPFHITPSILFFLTGLVLGDYRNVRSFIFKKSFTMVLLIFLIFIAVWGINDRLKLYISHTYYLSVRKVIENPSLYALLPNGKIVRKEFAPEGGGPLTKKEIDYMIEAYLPKVLKIYPEYSEEPDVYLYLANTYVSRGKTHRAENLIKEALKLNNYPAYYFILGEIERKRGDYRKAIEHYKLAYWVWKPNKTLNLFNHAFNISYCYYRLSNWEKALYWINQALSFPAESELLRWKAMEAKATYLYFLKRYPESIKILDELLSDMDEYSICNTFSKDESKLYKNAVEFRKKLANKQQENK